MEGLRVLLVDDEDELVFTVAERLKLRGYKVDAVTRGEDALKKIGETKYDVAVVDVKMPGMSGMALLIFIKKEYPNLPVILLTGHGSTEEGEVGLKQGAFSYLFKPVNIEDLIKNMKEAVGENS